MKKSVSMVALALVTALACKGKSSADGKYRTEKVGRGTVTMTVTSTGTISAVTTVLVGSQVSGVVAALYANFKDKVRKGQLLAELDPTPFQALVAQRQADVNKARIEAANAHTTFIREQRLAAAGLAAQSDLDGASAAYRSAEAGVQQSVAALSQAATNLSYTRILSPIDGVVIDRQYDIGQTVAASFSAPTLFSIAQDLTKMQVEADVDQSDIGRVQVGQIARFSVDAYPDTEFRGRISQIRLNAIVSQNVVSYPVIIEVSNPDGHLLPRMTANVTIDVAQVQNVLRIPNAALRFKPDTGTTTADPSSSGSGNPAGMAQGGRGGFAGAAGAMASGHHDQRAQKEQLVWLLDPATQKLRSASVRTGITDGHYTEVTGGSLKEGDVIVAGTATTKAEATSTGPGPMGGRPGGHVGGR